MKELLDAVWAVAADKIKTSYNEGYKAAMLAAYPDAAYFSSLAQDMSAIAKASSSAPGWRVVIETSIGSLILGFVLGVFTDARLSIK